MNTIFHILNPSNTLTVNRPLAHAIGLSEATVYAALISKCSYYEKVGRLDEDGWFYSTIPDLEESTALTEYQQKRCIANLVKVGLVESKNRGLPARRSFRIIEDIDLITSLISEGEKKQSAIKPAAAESYEKKRKGDNVPCSEETSEQENNVDVQGDYPRFRPCSEETTEQADEELPLLLRRNCGTGSEASPIHTYKSKENKSKVNNHLSINHTDTMDRMDNQRNSDIVSNSQRAEYREIICENIEYDYLIEANPTKKDRIDEIVSLMLDVVCSSKEYIRVNGEDFPKEVVKAQFLKLDEGHIDYVLMALDRCVSDIRNIRSYLITALYNAPHTIGSFFSAMVNHDMHG